MREEKRLQKVTLMNARYSDVDMQELLSAAFTEIEKRSGGYIVFANVDVVMKIEKDPALERAVREASYVVADGMPILWISRLFHRPLKEKISGSDFVPALCRRAAEMGKTLFFAGGQEEVLKKARENLEREIPGIPIVGTYSPPFGFENDPTEIEKMNQIIRAAGPDILIMCLGCPKQEKYIAANREKYGAGLSVCAGATIDFLSGNVRRCPPWMSRHGLEWFYRFLQEPKRLFKRYFIDDMQIARLIWKYRRQHRPEGRG